MQEQRRLLVMSVAAFLLAAWNGAAHADAGSDQVPAPQLLALEPVIVPIVDHGEMHGRLEVRAMWQLSASAGASAEVMLPPLRSALVQAAADHARLAATPGRPIDPQALSNALEGAARAAGFSGELLVLEASARSG